MPRTKKVEAEVKAKKKTKTPVTTKINPVKKLVKPVASKVSRAKLSLVKSVSKKITPVKAVKAKPAKVEKTTKPIIIKETKSVIQAEVSAVKKTPKVVKIRPTASVGTIKLTGKVADLINKYRHNQTDTGSTEVQIALFTAKINSLSKHLKKHIKDSDSKRGLLIMIGKRRRLLNYLARSAQKQYQELIKDLGLRK